MDAHQNLIRVDRVVNHTGAGHRVHCTDLLDEKQCPHPFNPSQFEEIKRNGSGRRMTGFQLISRTGNSPRANY